MYTFNFISDEYILVNPADFFHVSFDFSPTIRNCSSAPKGQPLVITYSNQIITGWYDVLVYTFTIGFAVRAVSQAQIPIYDWITVDELMDNNCETDEDEQIFSFWGQKMSTFECNNILIENYFNAILLGKEVLEPDVVLHDGRDAADDVRTSIQVPRPVSTELGSALPGQPSMLSHAFCLPLCFRTTKG